MIQHMQVFLSDSENKGRKFLTDENACWLSSGVCSVISSALLLILCCFCQWHWFLFWMKRTCVSELQPESNPEFYSVVSQSHCTSATLWWRPAIGRLIVQLFPHFLLPDGINWANHCNTSFQIRSGLYSVTMQSDFWSISSQMLRRSGGHIAGLPQQATVQPPTCSNCWADHKKPAANFAEICHWQILIVLRWKMIPKCASVVSQSCQSQLLVEWNQKHFCTCPVALVVKIKP